MSETEHGGAFYGRRVGKPLRKGQLEALDRALPHFLIDLDTVAEPTKLFARTVQDLRLEIGFGGGEHLLSEARRAPDVGYIGVEPFLNGMAKAAFELDLAPVDNVRVFDKDAALLLARLPESCLGQVELLYPDPWPKRRHWKRRFVRPDNLDLIARALRPGGVFRFASDVPDYVDWALREVRAHPAFRWTQTSASDWRTPYEGWPGTRYEAKAIAAGRVPTYLAFVRA
ncbi:tRNA (guanine-N(7)-)-methyltransferase [Azorhizobium oxalatiphilum]|uniref:tRNA (guanine-N(7)-)-methyltransferase n=1 Tax=Azorhizobium oxalatiphilum TaxID=980631 RepID=A0A917FHT3_9HYPH|nr:tRNA (guanine(46)-N(7))-methyltransferase TrmB [Azorhizobium oxalatiphilum]GGF79924.1 tRNA (guanine-N(7)-)-methyltransferase [Azorhizobium oxalatiphilum]